MRRGFENLKAYYFDVWASAIAALAGIPASISIALSSGLNPISGLVSNAIGTGVVGAISRSKFQVNGPTTSLAVSSALVFHEYGAMGLAFAVFVAGLIQVGLGLAKVGWWFKIFPPAVIEGTTVGIGILTLVTQCKYLINLNIWIGIATFVLLSAMDIFSFPALKRLSPVVIVVGLTSGVVYYFAIPCSRVEIDGQTMLNFVVPWRFSEISIIGDWHLWISAFSISFIASSKSMIVSSTVANAEQRFRFDSNRELKVQGIGNMLCGFLGVLPISAVTERSALTKWAGGETKASVILQAFWIGLFIFVFPSLIAVIPREVFAGLLLYGGYRIINKRLVWEALRVRNANTMVFIGSIAAVTTLNLAVGIVVGLVLALLNLALTFASDCNIKISENENEVVISLEGAFTFMNIPKIDAILKQLKPTSVVYISTAAVYYIDSGCLNYFRDLGTQLRANGGALHLDFGALINANHLPKNIRSEILADLRKLDRRAKSRGPQAGRRAIDAYIAKSADDDKKVS